MRCDRAFLLTFKVGAGKVYTKKGTWRKWSQTLHLPYRHAVRGFEQFSPCPGLQVISSTGVMVGGKLLKPMEHRGKGAGVVLLSCDTHTYSSFVYEWDIHEHSCSATSTLPLRIHFWLSSKPFRSIIIINLRQDEAPRICIRNGSQAQNQSPM